MKKILKYFLVFLLALAGGFVGNFAYDKLTYTPTVYSDTSIDESENSANATTVQYTTVETSDLKTAISKAYNSVVEISATTISTNFFSGESSGTSLGSGVLVSSDGYIITNNHVIENASDVVVTTYDGKEYQATLIGTDSKSDLAVIKIDVDGLDYAELADSDALELGDDVIVIGNPLGEGISVSNGIISALDKEVVINNETMYLIQTNAAVNQGNSGGGLFDINGDLIGIVNAKSGNTSTSVSVEGLGYAIPSNTVSKIVSDLMANGYVKNRATIGVKISSVTQSNGMFEAGIYIAEVVEDSAADKAGLQKYDRIVSFNGEEITTYSELSALLSKCSIGDEVTIGIIRDSQELEFTLTLQAATNE